jgi:hypothetical protein
MSALFKTINAYRLRNTLDEWLWRLFLDIIRGMENALEIVADKSLGKLSTNLVEEPMLT